MYDFQLVNNYQFILLLFTVFMDTEHKSKRTQRIQSLKMSLSKVPIISKNVSHISAKIDEMNELKKDGNDSLSNAKTNENEVQNFSIEAGLFEEKY